MTITASFFAFATAPRNRRLHDSLVYGLVTAVALVTLGAMVFGLTLLLTK
jgi:hypothetical protein